MLQRAYSVLDIKSIDDDKRIIEGIASTVATDRMDDIVEPRGAVFKLPIPLLWQHDSNRPVGNVIAARVSDTQISVTCQFEQVSEPASLKEELDRAWAMVKAKLVRGLSIGFNAIETAQIEGTWGRRFLKWELLELSAVTIPANAEATITTIRSIDATRRAALGPMPVRIIGRTLPPGAAGTTNPKITPKEGKSMTIAEQIASLEAMRQPKAMRFDELLEKSVAGGRTTDETERAELQTLKGELETIDADLDLLRFKEQQVMRTAAPVATTHSAAAASASRGGAVFATGKAAKPEPGIRLARLIRCKAIARMDNADVLRIAEREYGTRDPALVEYIKAGEQPAMSTAVGLDGFTPAEVGFGDYAEFLRPATIVGKFGTGNIPAFRRVGFRTGLVSMSQGSAGYWVGEAKPKPVSVVASGRRQLTPLKVAAIIVLTMEAIRDSSPSAELAIRQDMNEALVATMDLTFIDPSVSAVSNISPASITNGQDAIVSTGTDADAVRLDIRALFAKFAAVNDQAASAVLVMGVNNARALTFMTNALGQAEFPGMTSQGGSILGIPVIASDHIGDTVAMVAANNVYFADEGGVSVDMSTEASIEMKDADNLTQHADPTSTGSVMVSLWQGNLVGFRAERTLNWVYRRPVCAPYLTTVAWGEAVPAS